jgi:hypothetical protein
MELYYMVSHFTSLSARFDPGTGNVGKALELYEELQDRNDGYLAASVEEDGEQLRIHPNLAYPVGDVMGHAAAFVAECARRLNLRGAWSAHWSAVGFDKIELDSGVVMIDLATQAIVRANDKEAPYYDICISAVPGRYFSALRHYDKQTRKNLSLSLARIRLEKAINAIALLPSCSILAEKHFHEPTLLPFCNEQFAERIQWLCEHVGNDWAYVSRVIGINKEERVLRLKSDNAAVEFKLMFG